MANSVVTILEWLKEAAAYAYQLEEPDRPGGRLLVDVLVGGSCVCGALAQMGSIINA